jgi:tRNA-(ms[2]io[6]A)-hydroxylase
MPRKLLEFCTEYSVDVDVDKRWAEWLEFEGQLIQNYGTKEAING